MPHGGCYLWTQSLIALHTISDATIGLAYYSIPLALLYFVRQRKDLDWKFKWVFLCFAAFVLACGTTHLMEIWNIWHANYWLSGFIKAVTALVSVITAILIVKLMPKALALPSTKDLQKSRDELEIRVRERTVELQESEEKFRSLFNNAEVGMFRSRLDGLELIDINDKYLSIIGWKREEVLGKPSNMLWANPKEREEMVKLLKAKNQVDGFECQIHKKSGEVICCLTSLKFYPDTGILEGSITDITERRRAQAALEQSETRFRQIVASIEDVLYGVDSESLEFNYASPVFERMLGYTLDDVTRLGGREKFLAAVIQDGKFEEQRAGFRKLQATPTNAAPRWQAWWRCKDGSLKFIEDFSLPVYFEGGLQSTYGVLRDITKSKRAEEKLREGETHYRSLFDNMLNGFAYCRMIYEQDRPQDFVYIAVNDAFEKQTGLKDVVGRKVSEVIPGIRESDPKLLEIYGRVARTGVPERMENYVEPLKMWFDISVYSPRRDHFVAVFDVITQRKQVEEEMRWRTAFFEALVHSSRDGILVVDNHNKKITQNQRMTDLWKFPPEIASNPDDRLQYEFARRQTKDPSAFDEKSRQLVASSGVDIRDEIELKDGTVLERQTALVTGRNGEEYGRLWNFRDITGSKLIEKSLTRLGTAVEQASETIVITDTYGTILYANPAFEKSTGYTRAEAVGQNPRILKSGKQGPEFYRQMWEVLKFGEAWTGHFINKRKDGTLYEEEATISPIRDAKGIIINYVAVKRDVTREVQLESQLRQKQKMEAIGTLAGGVAHDFNNILAIIQMQASLLKEDGGLSAQQTKFADEITTTVERAAALTQQLLLFSRKEIPQLGDLDLNQSTADLAKMLRRILREDIGLQLKLASQPLFIRADQNMLNQVLLNLAVNARDAMPTGGVVIIETSAVEFDEFTASQSSQIRPGSFVCLSVSDTGDGIPPEILPRIFEPFFTTKEVGKGTGLGLGLATVFGIVQQHQGWINVYSEVGCGTTFKIYLPRLAGLTEQKIAQKMLATTPTGKETILLVEDETPLRDAIRQGLAQLGYHVLEAPNGVKALKVWQEHRAAIRLLLTDMVMPAGMSGNDLARRLMQDNPNLKVIYMSGHSAEVAGKSFPLEEGVNFLAKPFQIYKLAQTLRNRLDK